MLPIFISYRREDSAAFSGRLFDRLSDLFGAENVFIDVAAIGMGQDYVQAIEERIASSRTMLVIIGDEWLDALKHSSRSEENDFVQLEISTALRLNLKVVPVLVSGARMPGESELPPELAPLARRNAVEIRNSHFHQDVTALLAGLDGGDVTASSRPAKETSSRASGWKYLLAAAGVIILALGLSWFGGPQLDPGDLVGTWKAEVTSRQGTRYPIVFLFDSIAQQLTGEVRYPTGVGVINDAHVSDRLIQFQTEHVPQFETEAATIHFKGHVLGDRIDFVMQHDQGQDRFTAVKSSE